MIAMCDDSDARCDGPDASDDPDPTDGCDSSPPDCPTCGDPVHFVTASSLYSGTAYPCGCSVNPVLVTCDPADRGLGTGD